MTNSINCIHKEINPSGQKHQTVTNFKYVGAIIMAHIGCRIQSRNVVNNDQNITLRSKVRLMRTLIISILLYASETLPLTIIFLQRRIKAIEMRCYRRILHISYKDHITNEIMCKQFKQPSVLTKIYNNCEKKSYDGSDM